MKEIQLTRGHVAIVDDEDYEMLSQWKWCATSDQGWGVYAVRRVRDAHGKQSNLTMHRIIMRPADDMQVDHINGNTLDNRKVNLRICTPMQNGRNLRKNKKNTSGYKGVHWHMGRWTARIRVNGKIIYLGRYVEIKDAAAAYADASKKYHGEFGRIE